MTDEQTYAALSEHYLRWTGIALGEDTRDQAMNALRHACRVHGERDVSECLARLDARPADRAALFAQLRLGTTWFMREYDALAAAARALAQDAAERSGGHVTVWSAGCSSGQEPYVLAMALLEANCHPRILATDFNPAALAIAGAAVYPQRGTEAMPALWRERYLEPVGDDHVRIGAAARDHVTFVRHNFALDEMPPAGWQPFDAVICRNALMFLPRDAARCAVARLASACVPGGHLVLGAVEQPLFWILAGDARFGDGPVPIVRVSGGSPLRVPLERGQAPAATPTPDVDSAESADKARIAEALQYTDRRERAGDFAGALRALDEVLARTPLSPAAHVRRGWLLKRLKRHRDAVAALRAATFLGATGWLVSYSLAACLDALNEANDARIAYEAALRAIERGEAAGMGSLDDELDATRVTVRDACRVRVGALNRTTDA